MRKNRCLSKRVCTPHMSQVLCAHQIFMFSSDHSAYFRSVEKQRCRCSDMHKSQFQFNDIPLTVRCREGKSLILYADVEGSQSHSMQWLMFRLIWIQNTVFYYLFGTVSMAIKSQTYWQMPSWLHIELQYCLMAHQIVFGTFSNKEIWHLMYGQILCLVYLFFGQILNLLNTQFKEFQAAIYLDKVWLSLLHLPTKECRKKCKSKVPKIQKLWIKRYLTQNVFSH